MATPAWQPLPMQPPTAAQPPNTTPQNSQWGPPGTAANQGQPLPPRPMFPPPPGFPMGSQSMVVPCFGVPNQLNNVSGTSSSPSPSHQPQVSPAVSLGLPQANVAPLGPVGHGGPPLPSYSMPSTPPPGSSLPGPPTPPVHSGHGQGLFPPPGRPPPGVPPPSPSHAGSASPSAHAVHNALPPGVGISSAPPGHTGNNVSLPSQPGFVSPGQALPGSFQPVPPTGGLPSGYHGPSAPPVPSATAPPRAPPATPPASHSAPSGPSVPASTASLSTLTVPSTPLAAGQTASKSNLPPGHAASPVPPSPTHAGLGVLPPPVHPGSLPPSSSGYTHYHASFSGVWQSTNMGPPGLGPPGSTPPVPLGVRPQVDTSVLGPRPGVPPANSSSNQSMSGMPCPAVLQQPSYQPYHSSLAMGPSQLLGPWMGPPQIPPPQPPPYALYHNPYISPYSSQPPPAGAPSDGTYLSVPQASHAPHFKPPGVPEEAVSQATNGQSPSLWGHSTPVPGSPVLLSTKDVGEPFDGNSSDTESASPPAPGVPGLSEREDCVAAKEEKTEAAEKEGSEVGDSWTAHKTLDGTLYYYNAVTGQSTYDRPTGFKGEPEKIVAQPTPVSWERIDATDWALVITNDSKKYYYNTVTQVTSWHVPSEVTDIRKKKLSEESSSKQGADNISGTPVADKGTVSFSLNVSGTVVGGRDPSGFKAINSAGATALDLIKKKLQDTGAPVTSNSAVSTGPSPTGVTNGTSAGENNDAKILAAEENRELPKQNTDASSSDTSSDSDDEAPEPSKEERVLLFKEMLKERGVAPFSKWEKELPKIIFDPRFKAIPSHTERRSIFEHYVRTRADEERKEKRAAQKAAIEGFKQLLEEAAKDISHKTEYEGFAKLWCHDSRFEGLDRKDREALLNERVLPLRRAEEERLKAIHAAAVAGFNALLKEKGEITSNSRWSKVKDIIRHDPRYKAVKREDREAFFDTYVGELRAAEREAERAAKAKREEEEKLREREREMRKRKEREEQEMERVRAKARRKDAITSYQALLTEKIKDPEASWTENKPKLEKDPLGRAANPELDLADRERLFREHVHELYERCVREYRLLLADVITPDAAAKQLEDNKNILTSWSDAKKALRSDPRYNRMPRRDRESWWRKYAEDVQRRLKAASSIQKDEKPPGNSEVKDTTSETVKNSPGSRRHQGRK